MKLTKSQFKAVREVLGLTQAEFGELLGVSTIHISRSERRSDGNNSYEVSENLSKRVLQKLESMGINIVEVLDIAREGSLLHD